MRHGIWCIALLVAAHSATGAEDEQAKYFDSLSGRLISPLGQTYRHGRLFPLVVELTNTGDEPIPFKAFRSSHLCFRLTTAAGRFAGELCDQIHIPQWCHNPGVLQPGSSLRETVYLHRLRPPRLPEAEAQIRLAYELPISKPVPKSFPVKKYTSVCEITLLDDPRANTLGPGDIPERWQEDISLGYIEGLSIFGGTFSVEIDGKGGLIASADNANGIDVMLPEGRSEYTLSSNELHDLLQRINALGIDRLEETHAVNWTDVRKSYFSMSVRGKTFYVGGDLAPEKNPALMELKMMLCDFLDSTLKSRAVGSGIDRKDRMLLINFYFGAAIEPIPRIASIGDYGHSFIIDRIFGDHEARSVMLEIRRKKDNRFIARIPFANGLDSFVKQKPAEIHYRGVARITPEQAEKIGSVPDGDYLVAVYINGVHCGHVKQFTMDSGYVPESDNAIPACRDPLTSHLTELDKLWFDRPLQY